MIQDPSLLPGGRVPPASKGSVMDGLIGWLERNSLFRKKVPIPNIAFTYQHHTTTVFGVAPFNTAGQAIVQPVAAAFTGAFGYVAFTDPSILTRVELTISVRSNSANTYIGAFIVKDPTAPGVAFDITANNGIVMANVTSNQECVISKHFAWSPYSGYRMPPGSTLGLAVIGDNTGICTVNLNYHWVSSPGHAGE
jgi:hypothetical protein